MAKATATRERPDGRRQGDRRWPAECASSMSCGRRMRRGCVSILIDRSYRPKEAWKQALVGRRSRWGGGRGGTESASLWKERAAHLDESEDVTQAWPAQEVEKVQEGESSGRGSRSRRTCGRGRASASARSRRARRGVRRDSPSRRPTPRGRDAAQEVGLVEDAADVAREGRLRRADDLDGAGGNLRDEGSPRVSAALAVERCEEEEGDAPRPRGRGTGSAPWPARPNRSPTRRRPRRRPGPRRAPRARAPARR